jgi:hypothetical protein
MKQTLTILFSILLVLNLAGNLFSQTGEQIGGLKKLEFEVSGGIALIHEHDNFYNRISGTKEFIAQYAQYYDLTTALSGETVYKIKKLIPFNLSLNYNLSKIWRLKIGFEYSSGKALTEQQHTVKWAGVTETYDYSYDYRLSYLMPYLGVEGRFSSFGFYMNIGFNITDFSFTQALRYEEGGVLLLEEDEVYDVRGKAVAFVLGGKYMLKLGRKLKLLLKLEYLFLNINSFKGEKKVNGGTKVGTLYTFDLNPYAVGSFEYWDLYESEPDKPEIRNIGKLGLDLSCLRLMIGFSF